MLQLARRYDDGRDVQPKKTKLEDFSYPAQVEGTIQRVEGVPLHGDELGLEDLDELPHLVLQAVHPRRALQPQLPHEHSVQLPAEVATKPYVLDGLIDPNYAKILLVLPALLNYHDEENCRLFGLFAQGKTMGTVQIKLHQVRTYDPEGYKIENTIMTGAGETEGITPELFVFSYVDGANDIYQHVADASDLEALPERNQVGWDIYGQLFRQSSADLVYSNLTAAEEQAAVIKLRLQELATDYNTEVEAWDVTLDYTYKSDDNYVSIHVRQVGHQEADEEFKLTSTFPTETPTNPANITAYLFVYKYVDGITDTYARVATVNDINTLPQEGDEGWDTEDQYYRKVSSVVTFSTLSEAETLARTIRASLPALAQDYREYTNVFEGDEEVVYTT